MARDKADVWAEALVATLLETGGLELASKSSRAELVSIVARQLARGELRPTAIADAIMRFDGVSELHVEDDALAESLRRTQPSSGEVAVSDAAALLITQAMLRPEPVPPSPDPLAKLAPDANALFASARAAARRASHRETTLEHLLAEMLALPKIVDLARRRGGRPEEARMTVAKQLAAAATVKSMGPPPFAPRVFELLREAEELAPRQVSIGDLALSAISFVNEPHPLFVIAFGNGHLAPATSASFPASEAMSSHFTISRELLEALVLVYPRDNERARAERALEGASLAARIIAETERDLETTLPEDFWAAAAAGLDELAWLGIAATRPHGEPSAPEEIGEVVLTAMSDAESSDVDLDGLVAFVDLDDGASFLCVHRDCPPEARNTQPVFRVDVDGRTEYASFGAWVLAVSRAR